MYNWQICGLRKNGGLEVTGSNDLIDEAEEMWESGKEKKRSGTFFQGAAITFLKVRKGGGRSSVRSRGADALLDYWGIKERRKGSPGIKDMVLQEEYISQAETEKS